MCPDSDNNQLSEPITVSPRRRWLFRVFAIGLALVPFFGLELALRMFGIAEPQSEDRLVGFSAVSPLFQSNSGDLATAQESGRSPQTYRTSRSRGLFFGEQSFQMPKPQGTFRVFCLGGSTVRGRPYETPTSFARWMQLELNARSDTATRFEVINCGGLSYASYRLRLILNEVLRYHPDMVVVATGHNEFLENRTYTHLAARGPLRRWVEDSAHRLHSFTLLNHLVYGGGPRQLEPRLGDADDKTILPDEVDARLNHNHGYASYHRDPAWHTAVAHHFSESIAAMVSTCNKAEVPLLIVNLDANLSDTPPFKSEHRSEITPQQQLSWQEAFDRASGLDAQDPAAALATYQQAEKIDSRYALLLFRMARCYERLGQSSEARKYYRLSKDEDICPLRITEALRDQVAETCRVEEIPCVDSRKLLGGDQASPGFDWYTDHVHPSIEGHQKIGAALVEAAQQAGHLPDLQSWSDSERQSAYRDHINSLGDVYLSNGRQRVGWLEGWARRHLLFEESLPIDPTGNLRRGQRRVVFGEPEDAAQDFSIAIKEDPALLEEVIEFADRLWQQGLVSQASWLVHWLSESTMGQQLQGSVRFRQVKKQLSGASR